MKLKLFIVALFCSVLGWGQVTLVEWNFPNSPDNVTADGGVASNLTKTISTNGGASAITYSAGATTQSASASTWGSGSGTKWWEIEVETTGYGTITLSSKQRSSNTGPRDFKVQYKVGLAGTWTDVPITVTLADNFTSGVLTNIPIPGACDNQARVFFRWIMTSNTAVEGATAEKDRMFDALTDYKSAQNFYSLIADQVMTIQGKGLPFVQEDRVPLGIKIPSNGAYKIAIGAVDGLFAGNQNIYLEDKVLGVIHDLRQNPYSFSVNSGILNDRFVLRYTNETLGNEDFDNDFNVLIASSDVISILATNETIQSVQIHNVLGQLLVNEKNISSESFEINTLQKNKAPLIIEVTLENGKKINKKLIF